MNADDQPEDAAPGEPRPPVETPIDQSAEDTKTPAGDDSVDGGAARVSTLMEESKEQIAFGSPELDTQDSPGRRFSTIDECIRFLQAEGYQNVVSPDHAQGGEGWVFRATDSLGRDLAIKVPKPTGNEEQYNRSIAKLVREAKAINQLQDCPRVVDVWSCGPEGNPCYIVLRWIDGGSLRRRYLDDELSLDVCVGIVRDIAEALSQLHQQRIVHRDVKPANVLLDGNHHAWLTDFGLAQIGDEPGEGLGTIGYYPLDQLYAAREKQTVHSACDIFGLGAIFYELLYRAFLFVPPKQGSMNLWHQKLKQPLDDFWPTQPVRFGPGTLVPGDDGIGVASSFGSDDPTFALCAEELTQLCRQMLAPNVVERPMAQDVVDQLADWLKKDAEAKAPVPEEPVQVDEPERPPVSEILWKGNLRSGSQLVGRKKLIHSLNAATAQSSSRTNVFCIVGSTGLGKSSVVGEWLQQLDQQKQWAGFRRVIVWSFKAQRTPGNTPITGLTADQFVEQALRHLGAEFQIENENAIDRGRRLAMLIQQQPTLLVLDGLELLQFHRGDHTSGRRQGQCGDQTLVALLEELATKNPGLCVVTAQLPVVDLASWNDSTVRQERLSSLTTDEGIELLRGLGVSGPQERLEAAVNLFRGRPAPLVLFGHYVRNVCEGQVQSFDEVTWNDLVEYAHEDSDLVDVSSNLLENYRQWQARMQHDVEACLLDVACLFDRPAPIEWLRLVLQEPPIDGLTDRLVRLRKPDLYKSLKRLEDWGMLEPDDRDSRHRQVDVPPTVRAFFAEQLRSEQPKAWKQAHERLFRSLPETCPDKPDLMHVPTLVAAVWHGVQASLVEEAWQLHDERLNQHIDEHGHRMVGIHHLRNQLGSPDSERISLANFFDELWDRPVSTLPPQIQCEVLRSAGIVLRAVGRFDEACDPLEEATSRFLAIGKPQMAVNSLRHLGQTHLMRGNLKLALKFARQAIDIVESTEGISHGFERVQARATYANVLHHMGHDDEARQQFENADSDQQAIYERWCLENPNGARPGQRAEAPFLHGLAGYRYGHFLLSRGETRKVIERCADPLMAERSRGYPLAIGLTHLLHARAIDLESQQAGHPVSQDAAVLMDQGVEIVRQTGQYQFMVSAYLARAALYRRSRSFPEAHEELDRAKDMIDSCELKRHAVDWHLESAELAIDELKLDHKQSAELKTDARSELATVAVLLQELSDYESCKAIYRRLLDATGS